MEIKIVLIPSGGTEVKKVRDNVIDIHESSIVIIKVYTISMCCIYLPLVLVEFNFFLSKLTYKEKNDNSHHSLYAEKM